MSQPTAKLNTTMRKTILPTMPTQRNGELVGFQNWKKNVFFIFLLFCIKGWKLGFAVCSKAKGLVKENNFADYGNYHSPYFGGPKKFKSWRKLIFFKIFYNIKFKMSDETSLPEMWVINKNSKCWTYILLAIACKFMFHIPISWNVELCPERIFDD